MNVLIFNYLYVFIYQNFDNLFTSVSTNVKWMNSGIHIVGTFQINGIKKANAKLNNGKVLQKEVSSSCSVTTSSKNTKVLRWVDNNVVHMMSSFVGNDPQDNILWNRKTESYEKVSKLQGVIQHNRFKGAVELADIMIAHC